MIRGNISSVSDRDDHLIVAKKVSLRHRILLSPITKYAFPTLVLAGCLVSAVYLSMYFVLNNKVDAWISTCNVDANYRVDCFPGRSDVSYDECKDAECCWYDKDKFCFHSIPSRHGYTQKNNSAAYRENEILIPRRAASPFGSKNVESLALNVKKHSDPNHVEFVMKIGQATTPETKYENPFSDDKTNTRDSSEDDLSGKLLNFWPNNAARNTVNLQTDPESAMDVYVHTPEFSVTVTRRNDTSRSLLSTAHGPLILTEHYWELTLHVTNSSLYGLNQLELNGTTNWFYDNENVTSRLAFLGISDNGEGASCYVSHEGPMEIQVLNGSNLIVLRGFSLPSEISIHVFSGPTPLDAIKQLTNALRENEGNIDPVELANLGLHVCPNDEPTKIAEALTTVIDGMKKNNAPWDSYCIHREFNPTLGNSMDSDEISIINGTIERLAMEAEYRTIVPHLSPMVFADNVLASKLISNSLLLRNSSGDYTGSYQNRDVFYPDWHDPRTQEESLNFLDDYVNYFGNPKIVYTRDSWPKDETRGHPIPKNPTFDYMPAVLRGLMSNATVPYTLTSVSRGKSHYTEHASYATNFANFLNKRIESRGLVIRGLWGESGNSSWSALRAAIRVGVGSGMVGQLPSPMYACGSGEELEPAANKDELCSRWYGAAVAWPYLLALPSNLPNGHHLTMTSTSYVTKHLRLRVSLVTYARTMLAQHHLDGSPVLSPTSIHYPNELQARYRTDQFMWGYDLLVGMSIANIYPFSRAGVVTLPRVSQVSMWIPGKLPWRHLQGGDQVYPTTGTYTSITAVERHIVTLIRPGSIIPIHEIISTTSAATMKSGITLVANLACDGSTCYSRGKIFYGSVVDDGEFLIASANSTTLRLENLLKVKSKACNADATKVLQGTEIKRILVFGHGEYTVGEDFCENDNDSVEITLST